MAENLKARPEAIQTGYPLSPLQEAMLAESGGKRGTNITQVICSLPEKIDPKYMETAWQTAAARHGALRASFHWHPTPEQRFQPHVVVPFSLEEAASASEVNKVIDAKVTCQYFYCFFIPPVTPRKHPMSIVAVQYSFQQFLVEF